MKLGDLVKLCGALDPTGKALGIVVCRHASETTRSGTTLDTVIDVYWPEDGHPAGGYRRTELSEFLEVVNESR